MASRFDPNKYGNPFASKEAANDPAGKRLESSGKDKDRLALDGITPNVQNDAEEHIPHVQVDSTPVLECSEVSQHQQGKSALSLSAQKRPLLSKNSPTILSPSSATSRPRLGSIEQQEMAKVVETNHGTHREGPSTAKVGTQSSRSSPSDVNGQVQNSTRLSPAENAPVMDIHELLRHAKGENLKSIALRNRLREQESTTSLNDLQLARATDRTKLGDISSIIRVYANHDEGTEPLQEYSSIASRISEELHDVHYKETSGDLGPSRIGKRPLGISKEQITPQFIPPVQFTCKSKESTHSSDQAEAKTSRVHQPKRGLENSRWASDFDSSPVKADIHGHYTESAEPLPSDASQASEDSLIPLHAGKPFLRDRRMSVEPQLVGFDGNWQPPPIDWDDRPRFNNKSAEFRNAFRHWIQEVTYQTTDPDTDINRKPLSSTDILNLNLHPDGLALVERHVVIDSSNANRYGYTDITETTRFVHPPSPEDFTDWGKLDDSRLENHLHREECAETLVRNWRQNMAKRRAIMKARAETKQKLKELKESYVYEVNQYEPEINIYLRPAIRSDIPQITEIYNQHIQNGCRPAELDPISNADMRDRLLCARSGRLPFVVAVLRNRKSMISPDDQSQLAPGLGHGSGLQMTESRENAMVGIERVVGWACAQDFTVADFVERISVELEIYVKPEVCQKGVARCLMDQMLESLDRGYIKRGGYLFTCAQEFRHIYGPGGGRDVHKIMMIIRKYKYPKPAHDACPIDQQQTPSAAVLKNKDHEDDFDTWMKNWLEQSGFKLEGVLSGLGAKNGRFLDVAYMGKETMWQPKEGYIPDPLPGS